MTYNFPSPIKEEDLVNQRRFKVKKVIKTRQTAHPNQKLHKALTKARLNEYGALVHDRRFTSGLEQQLGVDMTTTMQTLERMSRAIIERPQLMQDAERADKMLLAAIQAKLEILDLL